MDKNVVITAAVTSFVTALIVSSSVQPAPVQKDAGKITQIESDIATLKSNFIDVRSKQFSSQLTVDSITSNEAYFTPTSKGYSKIATPAGSLIIRLMNIEKYANGYRLYFDIGNPTLATFYDAKLAVKLNKEWDYKIPYEDWQKHAKTNTIDLDSSLEPARWNHVVIAVAPVSDEETANIQVQLITDKLSLMR